jgi:DNA-directed RNA polymerase specialized sigma24 family protein
MRLRNGRVSNIENHRFSTRARTAQYDATIVRVIDFERCLSRLPELDRAALVLVVRDGFPKAHAADILGRSHRDTHKHVRSAIGRLARELDRDDLL